MAEEILEAEVIENDLAPIDMALNVNFDGLMARIADMNEAIAEAKKVEGECSVDDATLAEMPLDDVKRLEQGLSKAITAAETARKSFNGDYDTPKKAVGVAYQRAMESVMELRGRYKAQRKETEEAIKSGHKTALEEAYTEFMEGNGLTELAAAVPLSKFAEKGWWDSCAKNFSEKAQAEKMIRRASEIVADWNSVKSTPYHFPEQAQANFFDTLSLREVNERDAKMWEDAERVKAVNAEIEENRTYAQPEPVYEEVPPEAYEPDIVAQAEQVVAEAAPVTYVICADFTASQYAAMIDFLKSIGVHGIPMRTAYNGWKQASAMVKAVCNG